MMSVDQLAGWDVEMMKSNARKWYWDHIEHVDGIMAATKEAYAPSGSDIMRPELWKGAHWRWFKNTHKLEVKNAQ